MSISKEIKPISGINVTSLVDITMSLLIMFIITVPILNEQKIRSAVNIPVLSDSSYSEVVSENQKHVIISIDNIGNIGYSIAENNNTLEFTSVENAEDLMPILRQLDEYSVVSIEADSFADYKFVIDCIRVIAKTGINNIDLVYTSSIP